ncbi:MAG: O-antigen ligase family protein [Candidatus Eremiobacteraeota bacterium]|nr:O-antigen ligase family protein [Candidatus Eremiobacteraeota bacterium]
MQRMLASPSSRSSSVGIAIAAAFGIVACAAVTLFAGTKTGMVMALVSVAGPVLLYAAIVAPLVFPFCAYVALVPFDNILDISAFGTLTKILGIVSGAAILFYLVRTRKAVRPSPALLLFGALYFWMVLSAFWALDTASVFSLLPTMVALLVLYAAISLFPADERSVRWVVLTTILGSVVAALYGAYLFHHGLDARNNRLWITTDTGTIDPNHFAAAMLLPAALALGIAVYARKLVVVLAASAAVVVLLLGIAESGSRGAVLGVALGGIYIFVRTNRKLRLALIGLPMAIGAFLLSLQTSLWSRFGESIEYGGSGRVPIWHVGLHALQSYWFLGAGFNNFAFAYDRALMQTHQFAFEHWHRGPHDIVLQTWVEMGIVGVALVAAVWVSQFRMLSCIDRADRDYPMRLALEATLIATLVAALFLDIMAFKYVWLTFMLIALARNAHLRRVANHA